VVNAGEVLFDVAFQHIFVGMHKLGEPIHGGMSSLAFTTGVGIMDKNALENRLDDIAKGVMHDAVSERRGTNHAGFGVVDSEGAVSARTIRLGLEFLLKREEFCFDAVVKCLHPGVSAFALLRLPSG